jgi:HJR/Mrr/RecB family endonuclease
LAWSIGSFFLIILLFNWCYDFIWKRKIPSSNPSILKYNEAIANYNDWLNKEERKKKDYWFSLPGHAFEKEFGKILEKVGYSISITSGSADGGVDIIAEKSNVTKIIQCKAHKNPIGPGPIRELFGVLSSGDFKAKSSIIVCLGGFTKGAREFANNNHIEL